MRLLRGRVVIREITGRSTVLWTPAPGLRDVRTHVGRVLAMGPAALSASRADAREVEPGFVVGDVVQYHFTHLEELATNFWDGKRAHWIPQENVDAVIIDSAYHETETETETPHSEIDA